MDKAEKDSVESEKSPEENIKEIEEWINFNNIMEKEIKNDTLFKDLKIDKEEKDSVESEKSPEENIKEIEEWINFNNIMEKEIKNDTLFKDLKIDKAENEKMKAAFGEFLIDMKKAMKLSEEELKKLKDKNL